MGRKRTNSPTGAKPAASGRTAPAKPVLTTP